MSNKSTVCEINWGVFKEKTKQKRNKNKHKNWKITNKINGQHKTRKTRQQQKQKTKQKITTTKSPEVALNPNFAQHFLFPFRLTSWSVSSEGLAKSASWCTLGFLISFYLLCQGVPKVISDKYGDLKCNFIKGLSSFEQ